MIRASARRRSARTPWRRWAPFIAGAVLLLLAPVICYAQGAGADSVTLVWTAPGDDGMIGTASNYEMRVSQTPITLANWTAASVVSGLPSPMLAGTRQSVTVRGLSSGTTYYFAIRSVDDNGNWSGLSNVLRWDWVYDTAPPSAPSGLVASREGAAIRVRWSPNAEPDVAGYVVYRAFQSTTQPSRITSTLVSTNEYLDNGVPAGTEIVWYEVSAVDESGNESARSASFAVSLVAVITDWEIEVGYPNPSATWGNVTFPVTVPQAGPGGAVLDILDAGGHRVRRLDLGSLAGGSQNVTWDGANDSGRQVAPGVYRAWLIAGDTRKSVRLVRVP